MRFRGWKAIACAAVLVQGCGGGDESSGPKKTEEAALGCVVDPELLEAASACLDDDDCPCGAHCSLGVCEAACTSDSDCGEGERCDDFGRCRPAAVTALVPGPSPRPKARVRAIEPVARVGADGVGTLRFLIEEAEAGTVRIRTRGGVQIDCPGSGWAERCLLEEVETGTLAALPFRKDPEAPAGGEGEEAGQMLIFAGDSLTSVSVAKENAPRPRLPLEGVWSGLAFSKATGFEAGDASASSIVIPVEARIWGDETGAILEIVDGFGAVAGAAGSVVGTFALDDEGTDRLTGIADLPARRVVSRAFVAGAPDVDVIARARRASIEWRRASGLLTLELDDALEGIAAAESPTVSWSIALQRTGEVEGEAPARSEDATFELDVALAAGTQTSWEAALDEAVDDDDFFALPLSSLEYMNGTRDAELCFLHTRNPEILAYIGIGITPGAEFTFERPGDGELPETSIYAQSTLLAQAFRSFAYDRADIELQRAALISVEPSGMERPDGIPCEGEFTLGYVQGVGNFSDWRRHHYLDNCAQLVETLGCSVQGPTGGVDRQSYAATVRWDYELKEADGTVSQREANGELRYRWTRECVMPRTPAHCAQTVACLEPGEGVGDESLRHVGFGSVVGAASGELLCEDGIRSAAIALDDRADRPTSERPAPTRQDVLDDCISDIDRLRAGTDLPTVGYGDGFRQILEERGCFDAARFVNAIRLGLETAAGAPEGATARSEAGAYALRLMARWLDLHAYFATEALERDRMAAVLEEGATAHGELQARLDDSLGAWDLLLHPRFGELLVQLPPHVLVRNDYRGATSGMRRDNVQRAALPAAILDTIGKQAELLQRILERGAFQADPSVLERLRDAMPRWMAARAMAHGLWVRASESGLALPWSDRFSAAERRFTAGIGGVIAMADALRQGRNPLGIDDDDLPLYFLADDAAGPGGRFSAISDHLLGTGPGSNAWAPSLVSQAADALEAARASHLDQLDREYLIARDERDHQRWVGDVRDEYNAMLRDYCGPVAESLVDQTDFRAASCAVNFGDPSCRVDVDVWYDSWTHSDLLGRFCMHDELSPIGGVGSSGFTDEEAAAFAAACFADGMPTEGETTASPALVVGDCPDAFGGRCLHCEHRPGVEPLRLAASTLVFASPAPHDWNGEAARDEGALADVGTGLLSAAVDVCEARYPSMRLHPPQPSSLFEVPGCVRGTLGEAYLDVATAHREVEAARAAYGEHLEAYDIAVRSCQLLEAGSAALEALRQDHEANMTGLLTAKQVVDTNAAVASATKECTATLAGTDDGLPWAAAKTNASAAISCAAGAVEMGLNIASLNLEVEIEHAQRRHDAAVAKLEEQTEIRICYNDARHELVGLASAGIAIEQAIFDLQRAQSVVTQEIADADRIWEDGHAYLMEIEGYPVEPPSGVRWMDARVDTYLRRMKLAQRATYLAVRAVEYELQQSLDARGAVLLAETPGELEEVLQELWASAGTRTIGGSRPSELHVVLSLRDDVLRVGDESLWPEELQPLTPIERFRLLLASPRHAVYDDDGRYVGQQIPFELAPLGALGGETGGVPIYGSNDCAERIWSVNASILGENVFEGSDTSFLRLDLLKKNSFYSQWCGSAPEGRPFQSASVRPARNLFRVPGVGAPVGQEIGFGSDTSGWSRARMEAFLGIDRKTLEAPDYENGETSELAARGLFGSYRLFLPAEWIARESSSGHYGTGLVLDRVDDILLRLDYVSVAR